MWFSVQIVAYASLVLGYLLSLLLAVRHRYERGRAQRLLETALLLAAAWTLGLGLLAVLLPGGWWSFVWRRTAQAGLVVLAWLTADLADAFVQRSSRRWLRLAFVVLVAAAALALDVLPDYLLLGLLAVLPSWLGRTELATLLLVVAWLFSTALAWRAALVALRRAVGSKHRNRIRYLLTSLLGFTVGDVLVLVGGIPDVYVGLAARLLGFCILTFAILRYDLPDIRRWTLATIRLVLLVGFAAFLYLAAMLIAAFASIAFPGLPRLAVAAPLIGLGLLVAAVTDVLLAPRLHRLLDRILMGRDYDMQKALRDYSQRINLILDPERLADTTLDCLQTAFHAQRPAFILLTPQADDRVELKILKATSPSLPPKSFAVNSRFIAHFDKFGRPLSQYDVDMLTWFQAMAADERQWLRDLALDLYVPILVAGRPVALLALGPKAGGQPYSEEDLEALMILAGQTGTALENARLMNDLRSVQDDLHGLSTELAETNRQLARLDQAKTDFITIASHELRTPLTQIYGYSDILGRLEGDDLSDAQTVREFVDGITRGASRLKQVVDAMIDVSLLETGALKIHPVVVPLKVVMGNAVETVRPAIGERRLTLTVEDLSPLPYIQADGARLEQVFVSLLSNAVKFTPDGGEIVVSGQRLASSPEGECVELLVADSGIGVDPDQRDLIFGKFYRAENPMLHSTDSVRFKGAGPGLGLTIAKGLVDAHGGRIWVESPGRNEKTCPGSTFHIRLPVAGPTKG